VTSEPRDRDVSVSYDPGTETYRCTFDSATVSPSVAVVEAMAAVLETDPTDLEPLYDVIDPQGLDRICTESVPPQREGNRTVAFTYQGHRVTVESSGFVEMTPREDAAD
jgi:hypothetical protein